MNNNQIKNGLPGIHIILSNYSDMKKDIKKINSNISKIRKDINLIIEALNTNKN
jgi:hypothetical protein